MMDPAVELPTYDSQVNDSEKTPKDGIELENPSIIDIPDDRYKLITRGKDRAN